MTLIYEWSLVCHRRAPTVRARRFASEHRNKKKSPLTRTVPRRLMVLPLVGLPLSPAKKSSAGFGKHVAPARRRKFRHRSCIRWNISVIRTSDPLSYLFLPASLFLSLVPRRSSSSQQQTIFSLGSGHQGTPSFGNGLRRRLAATMCC